MLPTIVFLINLLFCPPEVKGNFWLALYLPDGLWNRVCMAHLQMQ